MCDVYVYQALFDEYGVNVRLSLITLLRSAVKNKLGRNDELVAVEDSKLAVLLNGMRASAAPETAELIRKAIADQALDCGDTRGPFQTTASIGLAWLRKEETMDDLFERADSVLF